MTYSSCFQEESVIEILIGRGAGSEGFAGVEEEGDGEGLGDTLLAEVEEERGELVQGFAVVFGTD